MKNLSKNSTEEFHPSPELKKVHKIYCYSSIIIGIFAWLISHILIILYLNEDYIMSSLFLIIMPLFAIFFMLFTLVPIYLIQGQNSSLLIPIFIFIVLPAFLIIVIGMLLSYPLSYMWRSYPYQEIPLINRIIIPLAITVPQVLGCALFYIIWIPKQIKSISYQLKGREIVQKKGVWLKSTTFVPCDSIINVTIKQGPIFRKYGIGTLEIYTAKHSNVSKPEIKIEGIDNFEQLKDNIMRCFYKKGE